MSVNQYPRPVNKLGRDSSLCQKLKRSQVETELHSTCMEMFKCFQKKSKEKKTQGPGGLHNGGWCGDDDPARRAVLQHTLA